MNRAHAMALGGLLVAAGLTPLSGCAFMGDVMHAEGDYAHKIGDAFKRQGQRREAAKARAAKAPRAAKRPAARVARE